MAHRAQGETGKVLAYEFREIVVEYGNETWHNGAGGYGWDGWGRPSWVHHGGREYGMFAKYMFQESVMKMPVWRKHNLSSKIRFARVRRSAHVRPNSEISVLRRPVAGCDPGPPCSINPTGRQRCPKVGSRHPGQLQQLVDTNRSASKPAEYAFEARPARFLSRVSSIRNRVLSPQCDPRTAATRIV